MPTEPKPPKPMPSADEINAYLELSAARTKLRLPLAKGAARVNELPNAAAPVVESEKPSPPISASKKLPTRQEEPSRTAAAPPAAGEAGADEVWRPFPGDEER
jgi:hypothetical protein